MKRPKTRTRLISAAPHRQIGERICVLLLCIANADCASVTGRFPDAQGVDVQRRDVQFAEASDAFDTRDAMEETSAADLAPRPDENSPDERDGFDVPVLDGEAEAGVDVVESGVSPGANCADIDCGSGLACVRYDGIPVCTWCGAAGEPTCPGDLCNDGLRVVQATTGQKYCLDDSRPGGSDGGPCGHGVTCVNANVHCETLTDGGGACIPCGGAGQPCCCSAAGCSCPFRVCLGSTETATVCR